MDDIDWSQANPHIAEGRVVSDLGFRPDKRDEFPSAVRNLGYEIIDATRLDRLVNWLSDRLNAHRAD